MREKIILTLIYIVVSLSGYLLGRAIGKIHSDAEQEMLYPRTAVVVEIDRPNDTVVCEDSVGMLWAFYGADDWELDDCVSLILDSRGTDIIYDDDIVSVRYSAFRVEGFE